MKNFFFIILLIQCAQLPENLHAQNQSQNAPLDLYDAVIDESEIKPWENIDDKIRKNFFLKADVTKTECYVGEPLMAIFKAYSRLDANSQVVKRPSLSGFSVIEMVDAYNNQPDIEKYNGKYFYVHLIRKVQLFPLQPGSFTLEPAEVESVIHLRKSDENQSTLRNLRNLFRRGRRENDPEMERQITFQTPPVNIHVNPLPVKGQPEDFAGAVGNFAVEMQMKDTAAIQRIPASVKLLISGTGNFPLVTDPEIKWPAGVEVSGPTVSEDVNKYAYPLSGKKVFQYTLEHRDTGSYTIPAIRFTYFDPSSKTYKIAETSPVNYTVSTGSVNTNPATNIIPRSIETPLHYYYFGVIVFVIIILIITQLVKRKKPG